MTTIELLEIAETLANLDEKQIEAIQAFCKIASEPVFLRVFGRTLNTTITALEEG